MITTAREIIIINNKTVTFKKSEVCLKHFRMQNLNNVSYKTHSPGQ